MGVSGNSVAGKSFQMFTVSEELLAKVVEAVQAGEKKAKSSGEVQSLEVFCHGFRQNISLGRLMIVPPAVCNDRKNFPTALLHGALVRIFGTGGEEISDLIEKKIGESEFDEYSQADFDSLKESLFFDPRTEKEACLVVFAPNWMNSREYISFHFTKDSEELKNNLRHQVFAAYFDPRVSSAFNAMMTNVNTTKVDVTDITPKMNFPFLAENILKEYPRLDKQAGGKKATILLNHKTADDVTKSTLDPQELDVFDSLNQALENSLMPEAEGAQGEGGFKGPTPDNKVPRAASAKTADVNPLAAHEAPFVNVGPGRDAAEEQENWTSTAKESQEHQDKQNEEKATKPIGIEIDSRGLPVHKGDDPKKHRAGTGYHTEVRPMDNTFKVTFEDGNTLTTGFNGTLQDAEAYYLKNDFQFGDTEEHPGDRLVRGVKVEQLNAPKTGSKTANAAGNPKTNQHDPSHPETLRVGKERLSSEVSKVFNGGFVRKDWVPNTVATYLDKEIGDADAYAPHAAADHEKAIEAGLFGDDGLNRRSNEKWGSAAVPVNFKRSTAEEFVADHIAKPIGNDFEAASDKTKKARAKKESLLNKFRPAKYAEEEISIDSIWDEITTDIGPAPLVDVESDPSNPAPSNTEGGESVSSTSGEGESEGTQSGGRLNKRDVQSMPEEMRSAEPEDTKSMSDSEADAQEDSTPHADSDTGDNTAPWEPKEGAWRVDSKLADFVGEIYDDVNDEEDEVPEGKQRVWCNQCEMLSINGVPCHEGGCPNEHKVWDPNAMPRYQTSRPDREYGEWVNEEPEEDDEVVFDNYEPEEEHEASDVDAAGAKYVGDNNPAMMASVKQADTADNELDIDAAGKPSDSETGESKTVSEHKKYDAQQSKGAKGKKADTADNPANEKGGEGAIKVKTEKTITNTHGTTPQYDVTGSAKKADTADNPYNMVNDGAGAPENKKVVRVKDTSGPTPDNTKAANQNKGVKQEVGEKHDHGIEGDIAQAKSECTSPDAVDKDIKQPTVSVLDAGKRKNSADVSKDFSEAKSELNYNKAEIADEPVATQTEGAEEAGGRKNSAEKIQLKCNECGKRYKVSPYNSDPQCPKCHGVDYDVDDSKNAAAGDHCPEEVEIDFGAGDLAGIIMTEDADGDEN